LFDIAFSHANEECRKSGLNVIAHVLNIFLEKHRSASSQEKKPIEAEDEDEVVHSEEEEQEESVQEKAIVAILKEYIGNLPELLSNSPNYTLEGSMLVGAREPLGLYRLLLTKLVLLILKMNKEELGDELVEHNVFKSLSDLIEKHPWNNFF